VSPAEYVHAPRQTTSHTSLSVLYEAWPLSWVTEVSVQRGLKLSLATSPRLTRQRPTPASSKSAYNACGSACSKRHAWLNVRVAVALVTCRGLPQATKKLGQTKSRRRCDADPVPNSQSQSFSRRYGSILPNSLSLHCCVSRTSTIDSQRGREAGVTEGGEMGMGLAHHTLHGVRAQ